MTLQCLSGLRNREVGQGETRERVDEKRRLSQNASVTTLKERTSNGNSLVFVGFPCPLFYFGDLSACGLS